MTTEEALENYKEAGSELLVARDKFLAAFENFKNIAYGMDYLDGKPVSLSDCYRHEMFEFGAAIERYQETEDYWFYLDAEADRLICEKLDDPEFWETASPAMKELKKMEDEADTKIEEVQVRYEVAAQKFHAAECVANFNAMDDLRLETLGAQNEKQEIRVKMHETLESERN